MFGIMNFPTEVLVQFDYIAQEIDELSIKKGDIIKDVVPKEDGWYEGILNGKRGVFPDNFVTVSAYKNYINYSKETCIKPKYL